MLKYISVSRLSRAQNVNDSSITYITVSANAGTLTLIKEYYHGYGTYVGVRLKVYKLVTTSTTTISISGRYGIGLDVFTI